MLLSAKTAKINQEVELKLRS